MESINLFKLPPKVFISYSHADRGFVEKLAHDLARNQILVWWDEWEIKVGDSLLQKIEAGITTTSYLIVVLSSTSVASVWVQEELRAALTRQLQEKRTIVLPVLLDNCEIPLFLRDKRYADFRDNYDSGFKNLIHAINSPDVGVQGREEIKEYFNDYAIDWHRKDGLYGFKVELTSHSPKLPYSVKANITANTNDKLSARLDQYIVAGFSWVIPSMLMIQITDAISIKPPILYIEDV
ncbi:MAG: toll/interleukin-1 receptor domain-containing protein [Anaerolineales bacterium]|nr:MAG: toll/interleukin-1 receptor domain-containing protein [Anaerolineales bacterium]